LLKDNDELKQKDEIILEKFNQQLDYHTKIEEQSMKNEAAMIK
jgi:hypothetical protein